MKKFAILFIAILFIAGNNYAQRNYSISVGLRPVSYEGKSIQLYYRDESPAPDNFYTNVDLSSTTLYNVSASFNRFTADDYYVGFGADINFGSYFAGQIGFCGGKPFYIAGNSNIKLLPMITAGVGMYRKDLGILENNTTWIQVNDIQFDDYENVELSLTGWYGFITPAFRAMYQIKYGLDFFVSLGYVITFTGSPDVDFSGNSNGESTVATEDLGVKNIAFYIDNRRSNESPFNLSGIEAKIGVNIRWQ